jgi:hypothetical protein
MMNRQRTEPVASLPKNDDGIRGEPLSDERPSLELECLAGSERTRTQRSAGTCNDQPGEFRPSGQDAIWSPEHSSDFLSFPFTIESTSYVRCVESRVQIESDHRVVSATEAPRPDLLPA